MTDGGAILVRTLKARIATAVGPSPCSTSQNT
jgi:hypothetical protein